MSGIGFLSRNRAIVALFLVLTLAGCASKKTLPNNAADLGLTANGAVPGSQQDFTQNVGDKIFFNTDSAVIRPDAAAILTKQVQWLNQYPNRVVTIDGHADERGTRDYNLALGERRANAAKNYLASLGVSPTRITTVSYGKERPEALGSNPSAWAQNRRAVTVVIR